MSELDELLEAGRWHPIANCPGRYTLAGELPALLRIILDEPGRTLEVVVPTARDRVLVARLEGGGGVIGYRRPDGSVLHTLHTPSGFARKLAQLGIELDPA